jgi:enamine deaminase RidA (YjgF/YER057c/UK114 family)
VVNSDTGSFLPVAHPFRVPRRCDKAARMTRRLISSGSAFEEQIGYSRAVVQDGWVFVSGTTGYDYAAMTIAPDVVAQCEQTFRNIDAALKQAGATMDDIVRASFILPDRADWPPCWPVVKKWLGKARPACTQIVAGLYTDAMKIEIEVTARLPQGAA